MTAAATLLLLALGIAPDALQQKGTIRVEVRSEGQPVSDATVTAAGINRRTAARDACTIPYTIGELAGELAQR